MTVGYRDAHCHLQDERLEPHLESIILALENSQVETLIVNGTCEQDWERVRLLADRYACVKPSYGLHPWYAHEASSGWAARLRDYLDTSAVSVGECGLDKWMRGADLDAQASVFRVQLRMAYERGLPVSVHGLQCWGRMLDVLRSEPLPACGFLLHSYSGPLELMDAFCELGAYFSFSGYFLHERKADRRELFAKIPMERLLIETDAPDMLPPEKLQAFELKDKAGEPINHPLNLVSVYPAVAALRGLDPAVFAERVAENFQQLFGV